MRPRKVVLCVSANEQQLSIQKFVVDNWGYHTIAALSASDALHILERDSIDVLILNLPLPARDELLKFAREAQPDIHTVAIGDTSRFDESCKVDAFLPNLQPAADLHERLKILTAKKRGPKKKPVESIHPHHNEVHYG